MQSVEWQLFHWPHLLYFDESFSFQKEEIMLLGNLEDRSKGLSSSWMVIYPQMSFVHWSLKTSPKLEFYYGPQYSWLHSKTDRLARSTWKLKEYLSINSSFCPLFDLCVISGTIVYFIFLDHFQTRPCFNTKPEKVQWSGFWLTHSARFLPLGQHSLFPSSRFCQHFCTHLT